MTALIFRFIVIVTHEQGEYFSRWQEKALVQSHPTHAASSAVRLNISGRFYALSALNNGNFDCYREVAGL